MKLIKTIVTFLIIAITLLSISLFVVWLYWLSLFYVLPLNRDEVSIYPIGKLKIKEDDTSLLVAFYNPSYKYSAFNKFLGSRDYDGYQIADFNLKGVKYKIWDKQPVYVESVCIVFTPKSVGFLGFDRICKVTEIKGHLNGETDSLINNSGMDSITSFIKNNKNRFKSLIYDVNVSYNIVNIENIDECDLNINDESNIILSKDCSIR